MALGDTYNNNEKKNYSPSVSSAYRYSNTESDIDKTQLSFSYWNKLLKISIAPKKETENGDIAFDHDNAGSVFLSHTKAYIFYKEICKFLEDPTGINNVGVSSGKDGLIYLSSGKEFNANGPCLSIRKIDENGHPTSNFVYEFRRGIHNSVVNYNEETAEFETHAFDTAEIEQMANLLKSYYESMTMAVAYSVQETNKYDTSRMNTKLKIIGEKLGVEFNKPSNGNRQSNNSYFSTNRASSSSTSSGFNGGSSSFTSGSMDDIN